MIRKRDRVVGTLAIWVGILIAMGMVLDRMNGLSVQMQNSWYFSGNVVTGASPEEATQILETFQSINNDLFVQVRQFAQGELMVYWPYFALLGIILLVGGVLSTMFIWRAVIVPAQISETITSRMTEDVADDASQSTTQSLASLLEDDGELHAVDPDFQPMSEQKQEQS